MKQVPRAVKVGNGFEIRLFCKKQTDVPGYTGDPYRKGWGRLSRITPMRCAVKGVSLGIFMTFLLIFVYL